MGTWHTRRFKYFFEQKEIIMKDTRYSSMQIDHYEQTAAGWTPENRNPVVGSFDEHNDWVDYDTFLFKDCINFDSCLDFGCGPGRNIVKYNSRFKTFDGVDLSQTNLDNALKWIQTNNCSIEKTKLIKCNGYNLENIQDNTYNVIISTITLQHICVHDIRMNYFKEFYRVLKPDGIFTAQMGYGVGHPMSVSYYENNYDATETNSRCDTRVEDPTQIEQDLSQCGFVNFKFYLRPVGPGDVHSQWIFFNAQKKLS